MSDKIFFQNWDAPESKPDKPVKPELKLKLNQNESNSLNKEIRSINLDNIPVLKSTPQPQNIQQPPKVSKPSLQPQPSKKPSNQSLPTPIATKQTTSEVKPKPNKPETSQSISKNDTQPKKPRKRQTQKNKLQRRQRRTALKKKPANRETPINNIQVEENVDTSLTEQPSPIQENNNDTQPKKPRKRQRENNKLQRRQRRIALKKKPANRETPIKNIQVEENVDTSLTEQSSPIQENNRDTQPKKPRKTQTQKNKLQRRQRRTALKKKPANRETPINNIQVEENVDTSLTEQPSPIQENNELKEKLSDIKDNQENNPTPSEKPSPTDTNRKKPTKKTRRRRNQERIRNQRDSKVTQETKKSELVSDLKQSSSNSNLERVLEKPADTQTSQNNSINETTNNPETNNIETDSTITNPESVSTSPNPVTTSQLEDIKGKNTGNNDIDTNTKKPNSNPTPSTTSNIPASENNLASGSAEISSDGRAACRKCKIVYPKWAERKRIQGRIVVAVDADAKGNVIPSSVRLVTSSGSKRLDSYHLKRVKKWKLKRSENGQKGVTIGYEYIFE